MGLDSYIYKTSKKAAKRKMQEILAVRNKAVAENGISCGNGWVIFFNDDMNYMAKLPSEIYWRKFNHITAWISEKVFLNPHNTLSKTIGIVSKQDLIQLRQDCQKVLDRCTNIDGKWNIDEAYSKKVFPYLDKAFCGSTDYDEYFIEELQDAKRDIDNLLQTSYGTKTAFIFYADS